MSTQTQGPTVTTKSDKHCARYFPELLAELAARVPKGLNVIDPYGGTGRLHELTDVYGRGDLNITTLELEPEYAAWDERTVVADCITWGYDRLLKAQANKRSTGLLFGAVCTSVTYGNRLADTTMPDDTKRMGYVIDLNRQLAAGNSGALRNRHYRDHHRVSHGLYTSLVKPPRGDKAGGWYFLNIKNHETTEGVVDVAGWHLEILTALGWDLQALKTFERPGMFSHTNYDHPEQLLVFRRVSA